MKCPNCGYNFCCCCKQPPKIIRIIGDPDSTQSELSREQIQEMEDFAREKFGLPHRIVEEGRENPYRGQYVPRFIGRKS